jgi:hypothetical protein
VEALKRSRGFTKEDLHQALEQGMSNGFEVGDMPIKYSADLHRGSQYVDLVTIDRDGRLVH